jgi:hypothetical protein
MIGVQDDFVGFGFQQADDTHGMDAKAEGAVVKDSLIDAKLSDKLTVKPRFLPGFPEGGVFNFLVFQQPAAGQPPLSASWLFLTAGTYRHR